MSLQSFLLRQAFCNAAGKPLLSLACLILLPSALAFISIVGWMVYHNVVVFESFLRALFWALGEAMCMLRPSQRSSVTSHRLQSAVSFCAA